MRAQARPGSALTNPADNYERRRGWRAPTLISQRRLETRVLQRKTPNFSPSSFIQGLSMRFTIRQASCKLPAFKVSTLLERETLRRPKFNRLPKKCIKLLGRESSMGSRLVSSQTYVSGALPEREARTQERFTHSVVCLADIIQFSTMSRLFSTLTHDSPPIST